MEPNCQFCGSACVQICCTPSCQFYPYMCRSNCVSAASCKVHSHPIHLKNTIKIEMFKTRIEQKKQVVFQRINNLNKSQKRIINQIQSMTKQLQKQYMQLILIDENIESIKLSLHNPKSLTGNDIFKLLNSEFYNMEAPCNKLIIQLVTNLQSTFSLVEQALNNYKSFKQIKQVTQKIYSQCLELIKQQHYQQSIFMLQEIPVLNPLKTEVLFQLGYCYDKIGNISKAVKYYLSLSETNSNLKSDALNNLGSIYFKIKQFQKSIQFYSSAISINPRNPRYYCNRANTYTYIHQNQKSIEDYTQAILLDPTNASYYCNRGVCYQQLKMYQQSLIDFQKAIHLQDKNQDYIYNRESIVKLMNKIGG